MESLFSSSHHYKYMLKPSAFFPIISALFSVPTPSLISPFNLSSPLSLTHTRTLADTLAPLLSFRALFFIIKMAYEDQCQQGLKPKYDCLLFDVDDTLYPRSSGLLEEVTKNIQEYMIQKLGIEETEASQMNGVLYKSYGTSMAGLKAIGYDFDNDDYHRFVHGRLPYERLKPDHVLRNLLLSLPIRKVIFSNADQAHVAKVLSRLGLEDCFEGVICFETLNPFNYEDINACDGTGSWSPSYASKSQILDIIEHPCQSNPVSALPKSPVVCKPFEDAFEQAFKLANINPQKTVFFDDSVRNIMTGKLMGLHTVLVGTANRENGADYALESIHNMKEALSDLWKANDKSEARSFTRKVSMETTVTA